MYKKIGIIREGKVPADRRVAMTPEQCVQAMKKHRGIDLVVQSSPDRAFKDKEYEDHGIRVVHDIDDRELLIGVKEVPVDMLLQDKTYLFFSHTIKKQPYNRKLLRAILDKRITLLDLELLTDQEGHRVIAFGRWAGIVGAYNAFRTWQALHGGLGLRPAHDCHDRVEMEAELAEYRIPADLRLVITGNGRVAHGAMEVLDKRGLRRVAPEAFLSQTFDGAVYTVLDTSHIYTSRNGEAFSREAFRKDPGAFRSAMSPYLRKAHMYLACHFWQPGGPMIVDREQLQDPLRRVEVIADISCDIGQPVASTVRASTIAEPIYGYDPSTGTECAVGQAGSVAVMAVDNLPCELPRDASTAFGRDLLDKVLSELVKGEASAMVQRATIASQGVLKERFAYLQEWVDTPIVGSGTQAG